MCGIKNRSIAHSNNVYSYKDLNCNSNNLGFNKGRIAKTLDSIININRNNKVIIKPNKILNDYIGDINWRSINSTNMEFFIDFETINSNMGNISCEDNIGFERYQMIFMIGVGYTFKNKWISFKRK